MEAFPDLDDLTDAGVDMAQATDVFCGFACSSKVAPEIVAYLSDAFEQAFNTPEAQENLKNMGMTGNFLNAEDFQKYLDENYEAYAKVIETLGLKQ